MALSLSYYATNLFRSSYGKDRPDFFIWYPKGTTSAEKKLLHKLDFFILSYGCLAFFTKWLDQSNINNAYVSGMREDLSMFGTELNLATTCFQVGQILGPIPANLLLTWIPPRMLLPGLEFLWGILTIGTYAVTNVNQLYPLRFFIGFLEGSCFVGVQYVLGSWYKRSEIGKRTAIFAVAAYVATLVSGFLQSALLATMNGRNGIAAWRWVFIIDGIITLAVALYGYIVFPDTPYTTNAFYLSQDERKRCVERLAEDGRTEMNSFTWDLFSRTLRTWQVYVLTILWMFWNTTVGKVANLVFSLFLKNDPTRTWSVYDVNNIPTAINGWNIVMLLLLLTYVDATGCRMNAVAFNCAILIFGTVCLVIWEIPLGLKVVSFMFAGMDGPLSPIYYSWANILTSGDAQVRALTLAIMNSCGAVSALIMGQWAYPVTDAPKFSKGYRASLSLVIGMCVWVVVVRVLEMRALHKKENDVADEESNGSASGVEVVTEPKV
ncbi:MFS general substrate transporter [Microdochium trichocladiopsis]|uniref:MFS general substrate transporter n=1 Tax=Microdochium trichocladiopsis TaxID=1682393 RepID=A0A9P8Y1G6_9PEZI|nr:MFS general substrate transporter [Microdochium trichocladiopsis]KAH7027452.1 MFS general substrate transporter [Microdochium trichocladiopsis]